MTEIGLKSQEPTTLGLGSEETSLGLDYQPTQVIAGGGSRDLEEFFGLPQALPEAYHAMSEQEVTDTMEDIMGSLDTDLGDTVEYPEGSGQYMTRAQAITAQAKLSINN